jgi:hypothetical protein
MTTDEFLTRQPLSGELVAENFEGWEDWLKADFAEHAYDGHVGSRLLSQNPRVRVWEIRLAPGTEVRNFHQTRSARHPYLRIRELPSWLGSASRSFPDSLPAPVLPGGAALVEEPTRDSTDATARVSRGWFLVQDRPTPVVVTMLFRR